MKPKLIKDCKVGDTLYYVQDPMHHPGNDTFHIYPRSIEKIDHGYIHDTFTCKSISLYGESTYTFTHTDSDSHDSLILDTDYAYDKEDNGRYFTTYEGAVTFVNIQLQYRLHLVLKQLEWAEKHLGFADHHIFIKKTNKIRDGYTDYKKIELYDILNSDGKTTQWLDKKLKDKKVKVYKKHVETDHNGSERSYSFKPYEEFVKDFDTIEDAQRWMHKHDKSYYHGKSDMWFEGDRYFIKED